MIEDTISVESYIALSALSYADFELTKKGESISSEISYSRVKNMDKVDSEVWAARDGSVDGYKYLGELDDKSGFYGVAFLKESTDEVVFSFRGSEPLTVNNLLGAYRDWIETDMRMGLQNNLSNRLWPKRTRLLVTTSSTKSSSAGRAVLTSTQPAAVRHSTRKS